MWFVTKHLVLQGRDPVNGYVMRKGQTTASYQSDTERHNKKMVKLLEKLKKRLMTRICSMLAVFPSLASCGLACAAVPCAPVWPSGESDEMRIRYDISLQYLT